MLQSFYKLHHPLSSSKNIFNNCLDLQLYFLASILFTTSLVMALVKLVQVFEVNSSTLRSGKQILSQLEEATQSHRVAPSKSKQHLSQDTSTTSTGAFKLALVSKSYIPDSRSRSLSGVKGVSVSLAVVVELYLLLFNPLPLTLLLLLSKSWQF